MSKLVWDALEERTYELGVDHGVLYMNDQGLYDAAYAWNGLTAVNENPDGGEPNDHWADNIKYFSLTGAEQYKATIEAYTYPDAFAECDGSAEVVPGVYFGQQVRKPFGFCYRTGVGNAKDGQDVGYKLHLVYGCKASPSDKNYETINDSPEAIKFSWEINATPVTVEGYKPLSHITLNSTEVPAAKMKQLEDILYGVDAAAAVYTKTTDVTPQSGKTYYTKAGDVYTEFEGSTFETGVDYYELTSPAHEATAARLPMPQEVLEIVTAA